MDKIMDKKSLQKIVLLSVFATALLIFGARLLFMPPNMATHYHANFAVFIEGSRLNLSDDEYMEDVEGCRPDYLALQPEERVHMHNNEDTVTHIHDDGVTWAHFFQNLGFSLSDVSLTTDSGAVYQNDRSRSLKFILNGEPVETIANQLIKSEDQLLISYGSETYEQLMETQWNDVADSAHEHNEHPDPGSCSGNIDAGFWTKLRKAIWY